MTDNDPSEIVRSHPQTELPVTGVVVTGSAGFLGSHLVEHYLKLGVPVLGLDNLVTGSIKNVALFTGAIADGQYTFIEADVVKNWSTWKSSVPSQVRWSHVFHMASPTSPPVYQQIPHETLWVNSVGLNNAIQFADENRARVIFASTSEIYGDPEFSPQNEAYWGHVNSFGIRSCYDEAKRFGEALIFSHNQRFKTRHGLVRIFNTYGPRMAPFDGRVIVNFLVQAARGEDLTVYGHGQQTRSFCYVDDLIAALTRYAGLDIVEPVNMGSDREFTVLQLAEKVRDQITGGKAKIVHKEMPGDDPKQRRPDLTRAKKWLAPWEPKVSLTDGLNIMNEWLLKEDISIKKQNEIGPKL